MCGTEYKQIYFERQLSTLETGEWLLVKNLLAEMSNVAVKGFNHELWMASVCLASRCVALQFVVGEQIRPGVYTVYTQHKC